MGPRLKLLLVGLAILAGAQLITTLAILGSWPSPSARNEAATRPAVECPPACSSPAEATRTPAATALSPLAPAATPSASPAVQSPTSAPTSASAGIPTPTSVAASTPSATAPSQHDLTVAYVTMTERDANVTAQALGAVGSACRSGDIQSCRDGMVSARKAVRAYRSDLDRTAAPACLSSADGEIRQALGNLEDGFDKGISGVDNLDVNRVDQGVNEMTQGNQHLTSASALIKSASCQ